MILIIINFLSYFFLIVSFSIQAKYSQIHGKVGQFAVLKDLLTFVSAFIVTYIPFTYMINLHFHFLVNGLIHSIVAFISGVLFQNYYIKKQGISSEMGSHVWFSLVTGYVFLLISLIIQWLS